MKVTFLSPPPNLAGGQRVVAVYAKKLAQRGHEVEIICSKPRKMPTRRKIKSLLSGNGWPRNPSVKESHYHNYSVPFRIVRHGGPLGSRDIPPGDIVVATFWPTAYRAVELDRDRGLPVYLVQHDEGVVWHAEADATYKLPMLQICVSHWVADSIRARHPNANQIVVNNAVEFEKFHKGPSYAQRSMRFGFMHSNRKWKRCDLAIEALEIARNEVESLSAISIGLRFDEMLPSWIETMTNPDGDALSRGYGLCRAWLFSSDIEGFGLPILESMACGTPVIGTPAGAAPELIHRGGGILVPYNDSQAMAEAIIRMCKMNENQWQLMSDAAYTTATAYSWDDATDIFESTLAGLLKR